MREDEFSPLRLAPEVEEMLREATIVRLATVTPAGDPHVAPFWFTYDAGRIVVDTVENDTVRNLRNDDRVAVLVDLGEQFEQLRGAQLRGRARVFADDAAPPAVALAIQVLRAAHADEISSPQFAEYLSRETRAVVYVEILPTRARSWNLATA